MKTNISVFNHFHFFRFILISLFVSSVFDNAVAQDPEPVQLSNCVVIGNTLYAQGIEGWNEFVPYYNDRGNNDNYSVSSQEYKFSDIKTICLQNSDEWNKSISLNDGRQLIPIAELPNGVTLTMPEHVYITGTANNTNLDTPSFGLVQTNNGTIKGIKMTDLTVQYEPGVSFSLVCGTNKGTIEECEIVNCRIEIIREFENSVKSAALAVECAEGSKIENCMVKDFVCEKSSSVSEEVTINYAQLAVTDAYKTINYCCAVIAEAGSVENPLVLYSNDTNLDYSNINTTNRAFLVCVSDLDVTNTNNLVVKYDNSATDDYSETNKSSFKSQEGIDAALKEFCDQDNCSFDAIKYFRCKSDYSYSHSFDISTDKHYICELTDEEDPKIHIEVHTPRLSSEYFIDIKYSGSYVVKGSDGYQSMVNMIYNKKDGESYDFIISGSSSSVLDSTLIIIDGKFTNVTLPSGCTIRGGKNGNRLVVRQRVKDGILYPLFSKIESGAKVACLSIAFRSVKGEVGSHWNIGGPKGYVEIKKDFGLLAAENEGTIESVGLVYDDHQVDIHSVCPYKIAANDISVGGLVGVNKGTVKNTLCSAYFCCVNENETPITIGFIVGKNIGTVSDALLVFNDSVFIKEEDYYKKWDTKPIKNITKAHFVGDDKGTTDKLFAISQGGTEKTSDGVILLYSDANEERYCQSNNAMAQFSNPIKWKKKTNNDVDVLELSNYYLDVNNVSGVNNIDVTNDFELWTALKIIGEKPDKYCNSVVNLQSDIYCVPTVLTSLQLGTSIYPFEGTFNGNNHKIVGLSLFNTLDNIKEKPDPNDANKTNLYADYDGLFGFLGKNGSISNLELRDLLFRFPIDNDVFKNYRDNTINISLLANECAGAISNVFVSPIVIVNNVYDYYDEGYYDSECDCKRNAHWVTFEPKINLSLVANLDNGEEDESKQASINNVAVYLPNGGLQYKSYEDLETWWSDNEYYKLLKISFYNAYLYWCNFAQYFLAFKEESTCPTFESFVAWYKQLTGETLAIFTETIENCNFEDDSELLPLVTDFEAWYSAEAQAALRTADAAAWEAYANSQAGGDGNEVAVVATQNLCKSPGKGRTHKVCSAPSGKSNKSILLNPYDENAPLTEMQCTAEEFASGYAAHWLNYDDPGFTGNYNKMWSQGLLHPILATEKNKYVVKLEYYNEDNNDAHGFAYTKQFVKVGSQASVSYTDKPKSIVVGGTPLGEIGESSTSFKVPETPVNKGIVKVQFSFDSTLTGVSDEDAQPTVRIIAHGRVVTVSGAEGKQIAISDLRGLNIINQTATSPRTDIVVPERGIYVVKAGDAVGKVIID